MRSNIVAVCSLALLLAGCAVEGVVVQKVSRPSPDASLPGSEGVNSYVFRGPTGTSRLPITATPDVWPEINARYSFLLRDAQGNVRSQLVTPDVFARYEIGDHFNDLQPAPEAHDLSHPDDGKTIPPAVHHHRRATAQTHRASEIQRARHRLAKHTRSHGKKRTHLSARKAHRSHRA